MEKACPLVYNCDRVSKTPLRSWWWASGHEHPGHQFSIPPNPTVRWWVQAHSRLFLHCPQHIASASCPKVTVSAWAITISFKFAGRGGRKGEQHLAHFKGTSWKFHMSYTHGLKFSYIGTVIMEPEKSLLWCLFTQLQFKESELWNLGMKKEWIDIGKSSTKYRLLYWTTEGMLFPSRSTS